MPRPETIAEIRARLTTARTKLLESCANLPDAVMLQSCADGGWSIKDILAHVAMAESVNVRFARMMVEQNAPLQLGEFAAEFPDFPGEFELDKFNAWMAGRWRNNSLQEILATLNEVRRGTLAWLQTLTLEQLERQGEHVVWGNQSVRGMFRILVIHDRFHRNDIEKCKR